MPITTNPERLYREAVDNLFNGDMPKTKEDWLEVARYVASRVCPQHVLPAAVAVVGYHKESHDLVSPADVMKAAMKSRPAYELMAIAEGLKQVDEIFHPHASETIH